jgi:EAL domain-containing protein (putative c-di-GMP-specific phosphodiesterase class I)
MKVIAEEVEALEQGAFLLGEGGSIMQGYPFSKPLSAADYVQLLRHSL